ncbi:MAG: hypothetical protein ACREJ3_03245 [Polyangiaceae bacterium]
MRRKIPPSTTPTTRALRTTNAIDRVTHASVPYELVDGTVVARGWTELAESPDAMLAHAIDEAEQGQRPAAQPLSDGCRPTV